MKRLTFVVLALACVVLTNATVMGQVTTSATFPTAGASVSGVGTIAWTNPGEHLSDNGSYATATLTGSAISYYLPGDRLMDLRFPPTQR